jgi:hypothetical protein
VVVVLTQEYPSVVLMSSQVVKLGNFLLLMVMTFFTFEILEFNLYLLPSGIFSNIKSDNRWGVRVPHPYDITWCVFMSDLWISKY